MTFSIRARLLAVVVALAIVSSACGDSGGGDDDGSAAAMAASNVATEAAANAELHKIADAVYYEDVSGAFERAAAAVAQGDAAGAANLYREAALHAIAATNATSATEVIADYPLPPDISDPRCTRLAHYHPETSCHLHSTRPACHPQNALIYRVHDPAEESGHRYTTLPSCATPEDATEVTKDASDAVLAWQQAASAANAASAAANVWATNSQTNQ